VVKVVHSHIYTHTHTHTHTQTQWPWYAHLDGPLLPPDQGLHIDGVLALPLRERVWVGVCVWVCVCVCVRARVSMIVSVCSNIALCCLLHHVRE
jgi:hypothetical protein